MDAARLMFVASKGRLASALEAIPTGNNQLSVGLGGDIPIFPPLFFMGMLFIGLLLKLVCPAVPVLPKQLRALAVRLPVFLVMVGAFVATVKLSEQALAEAQTKVNFAAVVKVATGGPYQFSRNPIYVAGMMVLGPGLIVLFNSAYVALTVGGIASAYLVLWVVPVEETFLTGLLGAEYVAFLGSTPRFLPTTIQYFLIVLVVAHSVECAVKMSLFKRHKENSMLYHLAMTLAWGFVYWAQIEKEDKKTGDKNVKKGD